MSKTLRVVHDRQFDLVEDETAPDETPEGKLTHNGKVVRSLGTLPVVDARSGEEVERHKVLQTRKANETVLEVPDDFDPTPAALMHLVQTFTDRQAPADHVVGVKGDPELGKRVAALLGTEYLKE